MKNKEYQIIDSNVQFYNIWLKVQQYQKNFQDVLDALLLQKYIASLQV